MHRPVPSRRLLFAVLMLLLAVSPLLLWEAWTRATREPLDLWAATGRRIGASPMRSWALADAFAAYRGRPGQYAARKTINRHGFVSTPDLAVDKPAGTIRIAFLGGSSVAGMGRDLADDETWPWLTVEALRRLRPDRSFELINAALGGYTSFESHGRLWSRVRFFSPDVVVLCHGWNEMYYFDEVDALESWRTLPDGSWTLDRAPEAVASYPPLWVDHLIWPSQAITRVRLKLARTLQGEIGSGRALGQGFDPRGIDVWRTNLALIRETAAVIGAELFVAKQPTLIVAGLPEAERARCRYDYHGFDHDTHVEAFARLYAAIDAEIRPDRIIDLTGLSGRPENFFDHVHPTPEGAARIADAVARALAERLWGGSGARTPEGAGSGAGVTRGG